MLRGIDANPIPYFMSAIEAMDTELGRLLNSMTAEEKAIYCEEFEELAYSISSSLKDKKWVKALYIKAGLLANR